MELKYEENFGQNTLVCSGSFFYRLRFLQVLVTSQMTRQVFLSMLLRGCRCKGNFREVSYNREWFWERDCRSSREKR